MGGRAGGGAGSGMGVGRGGASTKAQYGRMTKMQSQGYSDFASQVFATNKETKIVIDTQAGKVFGKGKGVIQTGVTPKNVISIANAYSSKYKGSQAVKVNF